MTFHPSRIVPDAMSASRELGLLERRTAIASTAIGIAEPSSGGARGFVAGAVPAMTGEAASVVLASLVRHSGGDPRVMANLVILRARDLPFNSLRAEFAAEDCFTALSSASPTGSDGQRGNPPAAGAPASCGVFSKERRP